MMAPTGAENRRHPRVDTSVKVRFGFIDPPPSAPKVGKVEAETRNISEGGVFLELLGQKQLRDDAIGNFLLFKSTLDLEIWLGSSDAPINCKGKAVWIEKKVPGKEASYCRGVAVQFVEIKPEAVTQIRDYVQRILGQA
jgi:hypothetical protein